MPLTAIRSAVASQAQQIHITGPKIQPISGCSRAPATSAARLFSSWCMMRIGLHRPIILTACTLLPLAFDTWTGHRVGKRPVLPSVAAASAAWCYRGVSVSPVTALLAAKLFDVQVATRSTASMHFPAGLPGEKNSFGVSFSAALSFDGPDARFVILSHRATSAALTKTIGRAAFRRCRSGSGTTPVEAGGEIITDTVVSSILILTLSAPPCQTIEPAWKRQRTAISSTLPFFNPMI